MINKFKDEYFFLSNFYEADVEYNGIVYKNNEAAFQAQKTADKELQIKFSKLNPSEAKRLGRHIELRKDWEAIKEQVMYEICKAKFIQNPELLEKLILTGNRPLEEGNTWNDQIWGTVNGAGKNLLGKILMTIRKEAPENLLLDQVIQLNDKKKQLNYTNKYKNSNQER